ncbi:MAG TPA: hypothetical protein VIM11_14545 [Tepidisphaeraceae bacterium]|jgi:hypothetical protein
MRQKCVTFALVLSLLVCAATAVLWVQSYWVRHAISATLPHSLASVTASRGRIVLSWRADPQSSGLSFYHTTARPPETIRTYGPLGELGFFYDGRSTSTGASRFSVVFPMWLLLLLAGMMPAYWLVVRPTRRNIAGACPACSYNLKGNTSGTCPECGTPITTPK